MMRRYAFSLLELVFVIVIMGIIGKFGVEFLAQAYKGFIFSSVNHTLQANSEMAVENIAAKLQFRIKDSVIARDPGIDFQALASSDLDTNASVLEWVGADIDGFRGDSTPLWSGIIDLRDADTNATNLVSPETNTTALSTQIGILAHNNGTNDTTIADAAIYFIGSDSDINTGYGWDGVAIDTQTRTMHPIDVGAGTNQFKPVKGSDGANNSFSGIDVFEYYQLAWTAYAVEHNSTSGDLTLYYDYQPWEGENYSADGTPTLIMQNVSTFRFKAVGSVVKIQVCVKSDLVEDYSLCKEKTIF